MPEQQNNNLPGSEIIPLTVNVVVTTKLQANHSSPCVELRRSTTDYELIKKIVSCAFHGQPLIILPQFSDKMHSISSLVEKGILIKEEGQLFFAF